MINILMKNLQAAANEILTKQDKIIIGLLHTWHYSVLHEYA